MPQQQNFDKNPEQARAAHHNFFLRDRNTLTLDGVENVNSFDDRSVVLQTSLGELTIDGEGLTVSRLSVEDGKLDVSGTVYGVFYTDDRPKKRGLFGRGNK